jgi:hypothetical protein
MRIVTYWALCESAILTTFASCPDSKGNPQFRIFAAREMRARIFHPCIDPKPPDLFSQFRDSGGFSRHYTGGMSDDSCRSKLQPANSAGDDRNKQGAREEVSRETVEKDRACAAEAPKPGYRQRSVRLELGNAMRPPPTTQRSHTPRSTSTVTIAAGNHARSAVRTVARLLGASFAIKEPPPAPQ